MKRLSRHSSCCLFHRRPVGTEEELLVFIWSGGPLEFFDASPALQPFSYYQYRVRAHNSKGSAVSQWALAQTLQAKPENMAPPTATPTGELTVVGAQPVWRWHVMWSVSHCLTLFALWQGRTRPVWDGVNQLSPTVSSPSTDWFTGSTHRIQH